MEFFFFMCIILPIWFTKDVSASIVRVPYHGKIQGTERKSPLNKAYFAFEGIPYAMPPMGSNRFKFPKAMKPWYGTYVANTTYTCIQYVQFGNVNHGEYKVIGSEDCLYLNIYTPTLNATAELDVIAYIHGGSLMTGNAAGLGADYLLDHNVVYANFNYRLGAFGFLSTESKDLPGNNGLRDQILAMKWIKKNIQYFGGNPKSITLLGHSAGGASVHLHTMIPQSRDLFVRAISMSGTALTPKVLMEAPLAKTKKLAKKVGCPSSSIKKLIKCLQRRPGKQIVQTMIEFQPWLYAPSAPFGVVVDGNWLENDPLLHSHPYVLLQKKEVADIPWIVTRVGAEGLYPGAAYYKDEYLKEIDTEWNKLMPFILDYNYTVDAEMHDKVSQDIRAFYMKDKEVNKETFKTFISILSDRLFLHEIELSTRLHSSAIKSDVFSYFFNYRGAHSQSEVDSGSTDNIGVAHGDDRDYIFPTDKVNMRTTVNDTKMSEILVEIIISFAKSGKPKTPTDWKPVSKEQNDSFEYLQIDSPTKIIMSSQELREADKFWESLPIHESENLYRNNKVET